MGNGAEEWAASLYLFSFLLILISQEFLFLCFVCFFVFLKVGCVAVAFKTHLQWLRREASVHLMGISVL